MEMLKFLHRYGQHFKMSEYFPNRLEKTGVWMDTDEMNRSNLSRCVAGLNSGRPVLSPSSSSNYLTLR